MDSSIHRIGLVNWLLLLVAAAASFMVANTAGTSAGLVGVAFLGIGFLVSVVSYFQMRLYVRERLEQMEYEEIAKSRGDTTLFEGSEADTFPARRSREQFEKLFVPLFTGLLFLLECFLVYTLWKWLAKPAPLKLDRITLAMALYALFALILFLLGKYSARLASAERAWLLRPAAGYLMLGSIISFVTAVAEAAAYFEFRRVDGFVAKGLCIVLGFVTVETLVNLVLELYRPRVKGQVSRVLYESRLIALLGHPGGIITTLAQALDYQFGFKVSETWVYRFLERALAWLVLLQLGVLFISTSFVVIEPYEQGLLERFGAPVQGRDLLEPGIHFKWPWPIEKVYRHRTRAIQSIHVGADEDEGETHETTVLWTKAHFKDEFSLMVASREGSSVAPSDAVGEQSVPVNLLSASIPIQFRITNVRSWVYKQAEPEEMLRFISTREVVRYFVNVDVDDLLTSGRLGAAETLRKRIQARADEAGLGCEILMVGLEDVHPPVKIADAYEQVIGAIQEKQTNILFAQAYAAEKLPLAAAEATNIVLRAEAEKVSKAVTASAEAGHYLNQIVAHDAAPEVYRQRAYLDTLARATATTRKYVIATTNSHDVLLLNLEDKISKDLLDVSVPAPVSKK